MSHTLLMCRNCVQQDIGYERTQGSSWHRRPVFAWNSPPFFRVRARSHTIYKSPIFLWLISCIVQLKWVADFDENYCVRLFTVLPIYCGLFGASQPHSIGFIEIGCEHTNVCYLLHCIKMQIANINFRKCVRLFFFRCVLQRSTQMRTHVGLIYNNL